MTYEDPETAGVGPRAFRRTFRPSRIFAALPLVAALGCDPQAGPEYTGESLFALRGTVVLQEPRTDEIVPALAFFSGFERALVGGHVQGSFPAEFRLDVTEPPPESALFPLAGTSLGSAGKAAFGQIVVVPADHPRRAPFPETSSYTECDDDGVCTTFEDKCTPDGACLRRTLSCRTEACELVDTSGDPAVLEDRDSVGEARIECAGDTCLTVEQFCGTGNACYREIRRCDPSRESATTRLSTAGYEVCEVLSQTGDTSVTQWEDLEKPARDFVVLYVTQRMAWPNVGTLEPGYGLVEVTSSSDVDRIAYQACYTTRESARSTCTTSSMALSTSLTRPSPTRTPRRAFVANKNDSRVSARPP